MAWLNAFGYRVPKTVANESQGLYRPRFQGKVSLCRLANIDFRSLRTDTG